MRKAIQSKDDMLHERVKNLQRVHHKSFHSVKATDYAVRAVSYPECVLTSIHSDEGRVWKLYGVRAVQYPECIVTRTW